MKTLIVIFLMFSNLCSGQTKERQLGEYSVKGKIQLEDSDSITINSMILVTDLTSKKRAFTWPISLKPDGQFEVDKLAAGTYQLRFRVSPRDYHLSDTLFYVSGNSVHFLERKMKKKLCNYTAEEDIKDNAMKILVADGTVVDLGSIEDKMFEKRLG